VRVLARWVRNVPARKAVFVDPLSGACRRTVDSLTGA
jgi:hypothetical protein